jgi:hypothetical protein
MIREAQEGLHSVGYDTSLLRVLIRADLLPGYRGMSWENGAVLGAEAFSSQAMLNQVLEEELLHLQQKARGLFESFEPGTAKTLEEAVDAVRQFPLPDS